MKNGKLIVLVSGKKRSGKDYFANMLKDYRSDIKVMSFADPLKKIVADTFNISLTELEQYKNNPEDVTLPLPNGSITNFRLILQRFGTEAMKPIFGDDIWQRLLIEEANKCSENIIVVPDFRFPEEKVEGAITVRIIGSSDISDGDAHPSEVSLEGFDFDYYIDNSMKDPEALRLQVKKFIGVLEETL